MTKVNLNYGNETKTDILPWNILKSDVIYHGMPPTSSLVGGGVGGVKILEKFSLGRWGVRNFYFGGELYCWGGVILLGDGGEGGT